MFDKKQYDDDEIDEDEEKDQIFDIQRKVSDVLLSRGDVEEIEEIEELDEEEAGDEVPGLMEVH